MEYTNKNIIATPASASVGTVLLTVCIANLVSKMNTTEQHVQFIFTPPVETKSLTESAVARFGAQVQLPESPSPVLPMVSLETVVLAGATHRPVCSAPAIISSVSPHIKILQKFFNYFLFHSYIVGALKFIPSNIPSLERNPVLLQNS